MRRLIGCVGLIAWVAAIGLLFAAPVAASAVTRTVDAATGDDSSDGVSAPLATIQAALDLSTAGDVVVVNDGVYREGNLKFKSSRTSAARITLEAAAGASPVVRGSVPVTTWTDAGSAGPIYSATWDRYFGSGDSVFTDSTAGNEGGKDARTEARNQFFADSAHLREVPRQDELAPGTFFIDNASDRVHVWLSDGGDPNVRLMEGTNRSMLLSTGGHDRPTIRGLRFEHCSNPPQSHAAVRVLNGSFDVLLEDVAVRWAAGAGLDAGGDGLVVRRCDHRTTRTWSTSATGWATIRETFH